MTFKIKHILPVMLCGTFCSAKASLFSDSITNHLQMDDIRLIHPWLQSNNAAGLFALPQSLSEADVFAQKENGKFVNFSESDDSFTWGAKAASFTRLNERTVLSGVIEYNHFTGKHMGGSFFMDSDHMPFDIVDYDTNNRGKKQKETYHLNGAVSYKLNHLTLGTKVDYTAGNYAKQKDLRHTNELMDICTTVGAIYSTEHWDIGANYLFRKRNEGIFFNTYGSTDKVYNSLISYGGFWGVVEQFGVIGYTDKNEQKPLIDKFHGGALQLNWKITPRLSFYNEMEYLSRKGFYGIPATRKITYSHHNGNNWNYTGQLNFSGKKGTHLLHWTYLRENIHNHENIFRIESGSGGLDEIKYFGSLETLQKTVQNFRIEYTGYLGKNVEQPLWTLNGGFHYYNRDLKASFYPFFRKQNFHVSSFHISGTYHLYQGNNSIDFLLGTQFNSGGGTKAKDGIYATPGSNQKPPKNVPEYLDHEFEYLTTAQMHHLIGFSYTRKIKNTRVCANGGIQYEISHAFDAKFTDHAQQHNLLLHIGCSF